jgi:hypothetical protein
MGGRAIGPHGKTLPVDDVNLAASRLIGFLTATLIFSPAIPLAARALNPSSRTARRSALVTLPGAAVMLGVGLLAGSWAASHLTEAKSFWGIAFVVLILPLVTLSGAVAAGSLSGGGVRVFLGIFGGVAAAAAVYWPYQLHFLGQGTVWEGPYWRGLLWLTVACVGGAFGACVTAAVIMLRRPATESVSPD